MSSSVIGQPATRIDGRLKVTGGAASAIRARGRGVESAGGPVRSGRSQDLEDEPGTRAPAG